MDDYYNTRYTFDTVRNVVWKEIVRYLQKFIPAESSVLDLGAGYCDFVNNIKAVKKYAVDISEDFKKHIAKDVEGVVSLAWDIQNLQNNSIDVVHSSNLLEHFTDEELDKVILEIKRILKQGGILILIQPNYRYTKDRYFEDPTHKKIFTDDSLEEFLKKYNFSIVKKQAKFLPFSIKSRPSFLPISSLLVRMYINSPIKPFAGQMLFIAQKND